MTYSFSEGRGFEFPAWLEGLDPDPDQRKVIQSFYAAVFNLRSYIFSLILLCVTQPQYRWLTAIGQKKASSHPLTITRETRNIDKREELRSDSSISVQYWNNRSHGLNHMWGPGESEFIYQGFYTANPFWFMYPQKDLVKPHSQISSCKNKILIFCPICLSSNPQPEKDEFSKLTRCISCHTVH